MQFQSVYVLNKQDKIKLSILGILRQEQSTRINR